MPVMTTIASMTDKGFGGSQNNYAVYISYISTFTNANSGSVFLPSGIFDSKNNSLLGGTDDNSSGPPPNFGALIITDSNGNTQTQITLTDSTNPNQFSIRNVLFDSSDNPYIVGQAIEGAITKTVVASLDTSLNINWQRKITSNSANPTCAVFNNGNIYFGGIYNPATGNAVSFLSSYSTSGTLQSTVSIGSGCDRVTSIAFDGTNNYYVIAEENLASGIDGIQLYKYNSSNVFQWGTRLAGSVSINVGFHNSNCVCDVAGNVYVALIVSSTVYITYYNSSGTLQWQKSINQSLSSLEGLAIDVNGNAYISTLSGSGKIQLLKISNSGSIIWQNQFSAVTGSFGTYNTSNSLSWRNNNLLVMIYHGSNAYVVSVPDNGTKTGTYSLLTYLNISYALNNTPLTNGSESNNTSSLTFTDTTGPLTSSAGTLTQTLTSI